MAIKSFRDLEAWQLGMESVMQIYAVTGGFPLEERYGLTSQLRRAAIAIPSNISEGHQQGTKAYLHYVTKALGSLAEIETQLEVARRLHFAPASALAPATTLTSSLGRVLQGLKRSLAARRKQQLSSRRRDSRNSR